MDYSIIHLQKPNSFNVICGNGSAHVPRTENKGSVTCELCLDPNKLKQHIEKIVKSKVEVKKVKKVVLKYKEDIRTFFELQGPCGGKRWIYVNRVDTYTKKEEIKTSHVEARIKELKSCTNRIYHSFTVENLEI
jgi:hypothetical protein